MDRRLFLKRYGTLTAGSMLMPAVSFAGLSQDRDTFTWPANPPANWPGYHIVHPDPQAKFFPGDPNPAIYYKGKYHLHYLFKAPEGGLAMAHLSSADMVHWKWHPTVLRRNIIGCRSLLSGTAFFTKEGKPAIIFSDNQNVMLTYALDDNLEKWSKPVKVEADGTKIGVWDPDCWLNGDTYYAVSSTNGVRRINLIKSKDLKNWQYLGDLMHENFPLNLGVTANDDISCPNMFRIGNKWMLLCISHTFGCRYYLGDFKNEKYLPESHQLMNWQYISHGNQGRSLGFYFAPESMLTHDGRRVMWAWLFPDSSGTIPQGTQSLPRELELPSDGVLRIKPLTELRSLRYDERSKSDILVKNVQNYALNEMSGDKLEFEIVFKPLKGTHEINADLNIPRSFGIKVLCNENGENGIPVMIYPSKKALCVGEVFAPFEFMIDHETVLRVFIDNNIIEAFVNDRQAIAYAQKRNHSYSYNHLFSDQGNMAVEKITMWKIKSPWN